MLGSLVIIVDSWEKEISHILGYFNRNGISFRRQALSFGDYSCVLPTNPKLGINEDILFADKIVIERKNGLVELSNNFTSGRKQFENELKRAAGSKFLLMVERNNFDDIINYKYGTGLQPTAFLASIKTYEARYDMSTNFVSMAAAGRFIYSTLYYHSREYLGQSA